MKIQRFMNITALLAASFFMFSCTEATSETGTEKDASKEISKETSKETAATSSEKTAAAPSSDIEATIRATIAKHLGPVPIQKILPSEMPGFYEVIAQGQLIYISEDQQFLFPGPLLSIKSGELQNLSQISLRKVEMERAPERAKLIAGIGADNMVVFKAPEEKYVVNVFTDVDCAYCRRLHQNMAGYLERGITIRYLAFPRAGVGSGAYNKLVSVWCAKDRQSAMDNAKLKNKFDLTECDNPVADQYSLTRELGLSGTPALILEDGELISGFLEPDRLLKHLEKNNS